MLQQEMFYGKKLQQLEDRVLIDYKDCGLTSLKEAREFVRQQKTQQELQEEIQQEQYAEISTTLIADIIKQHHNGVRVTDTLVESYVELASSRLFTVDPVVLSIRKLNKLDRLIESRIDFDLDDGSTVAVTESTQQKLNNIFEQHPDVVQYMKASKENFLEVLNQLED